MFGSGRDELVDRLFLYTVGKMNEDLQTMFAGHTWIHGAKELDGRIDDSHAKRQGTGSISRSAGRARAVGHAGPFDALATRLHDRRL